MLAFKRVLDLTNKCRDELTYGVKLFHEISKIAQRLGASPPDVIRHATVYSARWILDIPNFVIEKPKMLAVGSSHRLHKFLDMMVLCNE